MRLEVNLSKLGKGARMLSSINYKDDANKRFFGFVVLGFLFRVNQL